MLRLRFWISLFVLAAVALPMYGQPVGFWKEQPIEVPVRSLMGISMADTGLGYAVGDVDVIAGRTGILLKKPGDPTWRTVPANVFNPPLTIALSSWAQDVHAIPNTAVAYISWRDDYRSLVYKTTNGGASWFSVSPLNPILYGIRYAVTFINQNEGIIVGEGPGRVHRTLNGGLSWTSYTLPVNPPLTDAKHTGSYWVVAGGDNTFFRYNPVSNRWINLSFQHSVEYFPTHLKVHFVNDNYGFLSGYNQNNPVHVMKTTNGGIDWNPVGNQPPFGPTPGGHKGVFFFDTLKGWVMSNHDEIAYTEDGGISWYSFQPQVFGGKPYPPANKMVFLNEAFGWAVGGAQRESGYPTVSYGWIMKWTGTQKPDISTTPVTASFDTMACQEEKIIRIPIRNSGTGSLTITGGQITFSRPEFDLRNITWPIVIPPGDTYEAEVAWSPPAGRFGPPPADSRMIIESNDAEHTPWTVQFGGDRIISRLTTRVTSLVFPTVCRGEASEAEVAVEAYGNLAPRILKVELFSSKGAIELISHVIGAPISGSDILRFVLRSEEAGSLSGKVLITTGSPDCPEVIELPFQAMIQSNEVEVVPGLLPFGDVCAGEEKVQYLRLTNLGNVPARLREIRRSGADSLFTLETDTTLQISSGGFTLLALRFAPATPDSFSSSAQFRLVFEPCADTVTIACSGRGVEAFVELDADSLLVVGPAPLGREVITSISLRNTGFLPTVIEEVWFEPAVPGLRLLSPVDLPDTLRPKEDIEVRFAYQAQNRDSVETMLRVSWSDPCGGEMAQPVLLITDEMPIAALPGALIFDVQTCEEDVIDSVEVRNTGQKPLAVFTATVTGCDAAHFRVLGPPLPVTVDPGKSFWIVLAYNAPQNGGSSAALVVNHNDLTVRGESRVVLNGRKKVNTLTVSGDTLGLLSLCPGVTGSRRFLLRNDNPEALLLSSVELMRGSPFVTLRHGPVPGSVDPGSAFELWVDVTLPADTAVDVEIRIVTDPCRAVYMLRFRAAVPVPLLRIEPDPLDLGIRPVSDTTAFAVRVINEDSIDVVIDTLVLGGASAAMYIATPLQGPRSLAPGERITVDMKLRQVKDTGRVAGTLCAIVSSPCPDTLCFDVTGQFVSTPFVFSTDTLRYTFAFCDTLLCDTVRIVNALTVPQRVVPAVSNPAVFSVEPDTATLLEPGDAMTYRLCARRPQTAIARGELLLQSDAAPASAIALVAVREDRDLVLPDTIDAGNLPSCETEGVVLLPVENRNRIDETVFDVSSDDAAFVVATPMPRLVRGGSTDTLVIRYRPAAPGTHTAQLTIRSRSGRCERVSVVTAVGRWGEAYIETDPASLLFANVVAGTAQSRSLRVTNRDMEGLVLAAVVALPAGIFSASAALPQPMPAGGTLDIPVVFQPDSARNYFGSLCLIFDAPCADTLCIPLEGAAIEGDLMFSRPRLRFDPLASCEERTDSVLLRNTGAAGVRLTGSSVSGAGAAGFTLMNPVIPGETLDAGAVRIFVVRFRAGDVPDGAASASLFVITDAPDQPVLELPLSGTRLRYDLPPVIVRDLGPLLLGSVTGFTVTVRNPGEAPLLLDGLRAHADYALGAPALPATVSGGDSLVCSFDITPTREGLLADTLVFDAAPCGGVVRIVVLASVLRQFIQTDLDLGQVPACETRSGIVTLRNNGSTPVELRGLDLTGATAADWTIENPPALPTMLAPGSQIVLTLAFVPVSGVFGPQEVLLVSSLRIDGRDLLFQSRLTADVRDGGLAFAATTFLGSGELGTQQSSVSVVGRNTTSFSIRVEELQFPSQPRLRPWTVSPALPADIAPGDSLRIVLYFTPDRLGMQNDSFLIRYSAPCATTLPVRVSYEGRGDILSFDVVAGDAAGAPDDTVDIPLLLTRDITGLNIVQWEASLSFNASMLYPVGVSAAGTLSANMSLDHAWDHAAGRVTVSAAGGRLEGSGDVLAVVRCLVLVGDDSTRVLRPGDADFGHPALRVADYRDGRFRLEGYCLADGTRLVGRSGGMQLSPPAPNPASASAVLRYTLAADTDIDLGLYDAQGRLIANLAAGRAVAGVHRHTVDCADLPAGTYIVVLRGGDAIVSERLTVVREGRGERGRRGGGEKWRGGEG